MSFKSTLHRLKSSLTGSSGEIVFGMSDGTVSILGLVLGVAAGGSSANAVVLAGATGAIAASVSMMAGCFMEIESERDEESMEKRERETEIARDPDAALGDLEKMLKEARLSQASIDSIRSDIGSNPSAIAEFETAISSSQKTSGQKESPVIHACWMFISDLIAGLTPVIPFILFPLQTAWIICITITTALLLLLGIGRAKLGNRSVFRTVPETMGIALAAAVAGVLVGLLIQRLIS